MKLMRDLGMISGLEQFTWSKSTYSATSNACVEVALIPDLVGVRDTKVRDGGTLAFGRSRWAAFTAALRQDASA